MSEITTILIVEDEIFNMMYIKEVLSAFDVNIIEAYNGKDAVNFCLENKTIKLVLMDIKMPVMDGLEATKLIKSKNASLPVIAVSAFALQSDIESALSIGCDAYIEKPIKRKLLLSEVTKYLFEK